MCKDLSYWGFSFLFSAGSTATLVISNICAEDIAEYACVTLNIQTTTKLEPGKEGQDVKLTCKLSGPVEKVQWHKRGGFLVDEKLRYTKYSVDRGKYKLHESCLCH